MLFIPAGLTSLYQPVDVSVNKPFKDRVRHNRILFRRLIRQTLNRTEFPEDIYDTDFRTQCLWLIRQQLPLQAQNRLYSAISILESWKNVSLDTIVNGWRHIGITNGSNT